MCNTIHVTWHERQRIILDVHTAIFVYMHPREEKKDGCKELLTLPRIESFYPSSKRKVYRSYWYLFLKLMQVLGTLILKFCNLSNIWLVTVQLIIWLLFSLNFTLYYGDNRYINRMFCSWTIPVCNWTEFCYDMTGAQFYTIYNKYHQ